MPMAREAKPRAIKSREPSPRQWEWHRSIVKLRRFSNRIRKASEPLRKLNERFRALSEPFQRFYEVPDPLLDEKHRQAEEEQRRERDWESVRQALADQERRRERDREALARAIAKAIADSAPAPAPVDAKNATSTGTSPPPPPPVPSPPPLLRKPPSTKDWIRQAVADNPRREGERIRAYARRLFKEVAEPQGYDGLTAIGIDRALRRYKLV
jgi:hypothetical protein